MKELIQNFKALSDETRLRVLILLLERECCVCEVMQALIISQSRASRALNSLYNTGILKLRKEGRWSLYSIDREGMDEHLDYMVKAVVKALEGNRLTEIDLERLRKAERTSPACVESNRRMKAEQ